MISSFDDMENAWNLHFGADAFQQIQRTERIAGALHKQNRSLQGAEDFIAEFCSITTAAEWISQTNDRANFFFKSDVASDTTAHALTDQNRRCSCAWSR